MVWWVSNRCRSRFCADRMVRSPLLCCLLAERVQAAFAFTLYAYCGTISTERCKMMVAWVPGVVIPLTISTELILGMRCYAIWGRQRWILVMLAVLLVAESGVMILAAGGWSRYIIRSWRLSTEQLASSPW